MTTLTREQKEEVFNLVKSYDIGEFVIEITYDSGGEEITDVLI